MHKSILTYCLIFLFSLTISAQETESVEKPQEEKKTESVRSTPKPYNNEGTLKDQFDYMLKKSNRYQIFKVVRINWLNKFESNVQDSLNVFRTQINDANVLIDKQSGEITALKEEVLKIQNQLDNTVKLKDSMKFLGMDLPKSTYNTLMWVLILGSLVVAGICFMLFKRSNVVTVETKQTLEDVREEFDTHRKNALVREQKLARRLQDEVIKNKNLGL